MTESNYNSVKLSKKDIVEMTVMYETGNYSQADLASKFGVSVVTVNKILQAQGAQKGIAGEELVNKVKKKLDDEYNEEAEKRVKEIKVAKLESAYWPRMVGNLIAKEVSKLAETNGATPLSPQEISRISEKIKLLKDASVGLNNVMMQRWKALGIDNEISEETIPELAIQDLTEEALLEIHKKTRYQAQAQEENEEEKDDLGLNNLNLEFNNDKAGI